MRKCRYIRACGMGLCTKGGATLRTYERACRCAVTLFAWARMCVRACVSGWLVDLHAVPGACIAHGITTVVSREVKGDLLSESTLLQGFHCGCVSIGLSLKLCVCRAILKVVCLQGFRSGREGGWNSGLRPHRSTSAAAPEGVRPFRMPCRLSR